MRKNDIVEIGRCLCLTPMEIVEGSQDSWFRHLCIDSLTGNQE